MYRKVFGRSEYHVSIVGATRNSTEVISNDKALVTRSSIRHIHRAGLVDCDILNDSRCSSIRKETRTVGLPIQQCATATVEYAVERCSRSNGYARQINVATQNDLTVGILPSRIVVCRTSIEERLQLSCVGNLVLLLVRIELYLRHHEYLACIDDATRCRVCRLGQIRTIGCDNLDRKALGIYTRSNRSNDNGNILCIRDGTLCLDLNEIATCVWTDKFTRSIINLECARQRLQIVGANDNLLNLFLVALSDREFDETANVLQRNLLGLGDTYHRCSLIAERRCNIVLCDVGNDNVSVCIDSICRINHFIRSKNARNFE